MLFYCIYLFHNIARPGEDPFAGNNGFISQIHDYNTGKEQGSLISSLFPIRRDLFLNKKSYINYIKNPS